ncbi:MAG: bifunctional enoyl-CoA hydratase/phosphate acetyltransferase [Rhodospirillales bacterium]
MTEMLENKTFDEIRVGDTVSFSGALREEDIETWAAVTANPNVMTLKQAATGEDDFLEASGVGTWGTALFSTLIGTRLPGVGSFTRSAEARFPRPFPVGQPITVTVTVTEKRADEGVVILECRCVDAGGNELITGRAEVVTPKEKIRQPVIEMPKVRLRREDRYLELLKMCEDLEAVTTAVVHPCSDDALKGAVQAAERGLIDPILVGPEAKIRSVADETGLDIAPYRLIPTEHSHHAAEEAVALVRAGEAEAMMKGSLHTDELLRAVVHKQLGIRTERRLSHCFLLSVPTYERAIILTDAAINIFPDLGIKRDICQNAIDLAHALGIATPKVAILSAVETVTPSIPSTLEAAALCKMADRGQIKGALLDGPLAFDNAVDEEAARTKGIVSPVAGVADILVVPDLEAGNMLAKQLTFMADAEAAGIVLGARVPIVLTSRADSARTRLASCALAVLLVHRQRRGAAPKLAAG